MAYTANAGFAAGMEDIPDVYTRPEDKARPPVRMDECPKQLTGETRIPLPAEPGDAERYDTEHARNGACEIFMCTAPLLGWRRAEAAGHRARLDWAARTKKLAGKDFPFAEKIVLAMDSLNTHSISSLYEAFEPEEARRIRYRLK
ncbi:MAG: IS630 family transposase, partial [Spirochaetaceae bacterium]|nr:IS630 family transposase [Spirochaetaceae bacterium]